MVPLFAAPWLPAGEPESFPGPTGLITSVADRDRVQTSNSQFSLTLDSNFYGSDDNGLLLERGVIVMDGEYGEPLMTLFAKSFLNILFYIMYIYMII